MSGSASRERRPLDLPLGEGVEVLARDPNGLIALGKPSGLLSHPNEPGETSRSLLRCPYSLEEEHYEWKRADGSTGRLWLLNRLDSATSGVLLAATTLRLAKTIREQFLHKQISKVYNALVFGAPAVPRQLWKDRLAVEKSGAKVRTSRGGHIPCECSMELLARRSGGPPALSLLQLEPRTGRSHQLRVQCSLRTLPIIGDATYGNFAANRNFARDFGLRRLFLHSLETSLDYVYLEKPFHFEAKAPLPLEFTRLLQA